MGCICRWFGAVASSAYYCQEGGLGCAVAEVLAEGDYVPLLRIGVPDEFGQSGLADDLLDYYGLTGEKTAVQIEVAWRKRQNVRY